MKRWLVPVAAMIIAFAAISSCKKIVSAVFSGTDVNIPPVEFTVPILLAVSPTEQSFGSYVQPINLDSTIRANTAGLFGINAVSTIQLKTVKITSTNADALNNLSSFESARVTIFSNSNPQPLEIFTVNFPDENLTTYNFTPGNTVELLPYLRGNSVSYNISGKNRRITSKPIQLQVAITLRAN